MLDKLKICLPLAAIPLIWMAALMLGGFTHLKNMAMDWRFKVRGPLPAPVKLYYLYIDAKTIEELGEKPWPRGKFGLAAAALLELGGARAVGFDIVFSKYFHSQLVSEEKSRNDTEMLAQVTNSCPEIILACAYTREDKKHYFYQEDYSSFDNEPPETPMPVFVRNHGIHQMGFINPDFDKSAGPTPRWTAMFVEYKLKQGETVREYVYYHMALQLARVYLGLPPEAIQRYPERIELTGPDGQPAIPPVPLWKQQMTEINWFSKFYDERYSKGFSLIEVLGSLQDYLDAEAAGDEAAKAEIQKTFDFFKDSVVLVGATDPLLLDVAPTPFDAAPVPKVGVHGNLLKTLVTGKYIKRFPPWMEAVFILGLTFLVTFFFMASGKHTRLYKASGLITLTGYIGVSFMLFNAYHLVVPLVVPVGAAFSTSLAGAIVQLLIEEKQKGRIKGMFGAYLSPQLVNRMVEAGEEPKLGGVDENITAFFSDIQSFSSFSEILPPDRLVELMNEYLGAMTDILQDEGGTLDKYIGDAIVAMFNAPVRLQRHALRACRAACLMQQRQARLRRKWQAEGNKWPPIVSAMRTRIGLNTGRATVGNMGSRLRFNYTMMGDTVNIAARAESGAKSYGVYTMATEDAKREAETHGNECVFRFLDRVQVKGRSTPLDMYEIMNLRADTEPDVFECAGYYEEAMNKYLGQDWDGARALFEKSSRLEPRQPGRDPGIHTNPSLILIERLSYMKANPPGDAWDGVFVMKTK